MTTGTHSDSIMIWDDHETPSSPFITEVGDTSRQTSNQIKPSNTARCEVDMPMNNAMTPLPRRVAVLDSDKENASPESPSETPYKTPMTMPDRATTGRKIGRGQMLPPPTITKGSEALSTSTPHTSQLMGRWEEATPSQPKSSRPSGCETARVSEQTATEEAGIDDTCFSAFSAVPDMTLFAKLGQRSPGRTDSFDATPRAASKKRVTPSRSPSPGPQRHKPQNETTSLLIDFTQQIENFTIPQQSPTKTFGFGPGRTENKLLSHLNNARSPPKRSPAGTLAQSPSKSSLLNLLDFELPPPPTPRSAPQFTAREVESLKSGFQSQLSGIKAKLSGKEAEVDALKKALEDAERRVGEAQERERTERVKREDSERERDSWEQRGTEVEKVLSSVREEVLAAEGEREALERRAGEADERTRDLEARNADLLAKLATGGEMSGEKGDEVARLVQMQLDARIEGVSRELHAVYKKKHESKVATLKKSYEARGEKKCAELQARLDDALRVADELRTARDETFSGDLGLKKGGSGSDAGLQAELDEKRAEAERCRAEVEERVARVAGLEGELQSFRADFARLQVELEAERVEKGELVAAVDEMLALQAGGGVADTSVVEDFRKSLQRPSAVRQPVAPAIVSAVSESRLARPSGLARYAPGKSKMMSNIERMGGGRPAE